MDHTDGGKTYRDGSNYADDNVATSSIVDTLNPENVSHNMNDLNAIEFNSADDVRQAIKAVLSGKRQVLDESSFTGMETTAQIEVFPNSQVQTTSQPPRERKKSKMQQAHEVFQRLPPEKPSPKKRRGRPPKAGTSRKIKKPNRDAMFRGKLSNFVRFKRYQGSEAGSDVRK